MFYETYAEITGIIQWFLLVIGYCNLYMMTYKINYRFQLKKICSVSSAKGRVRLGRAGLQTKQNRFF